MNAQPLVKLAGLTLVLFLATPAVADRVVCTSAVVRYNQDGNQGYVAGAAYSNGNLYTEYQVSPVFGPAPRTELAGFWRWQNHDQYVAAKRAVVHGCNKVSQVNPANAFACDFSAPPKCRME